MLLENIIFIFFQYSGIIAIPFIIVFTILYLRNKDKKVYKILLIISIILFVIDIILYIIVFNSLDEIFKTIKDNVANLII